MHEPKRHIVVTGASRGFGNALSREFLNHMWTVVPLVRTRIDADALKSIAPTHCVPVIADVTSDSISHAFCRTLANLGAIDVLINNAGTGSQGPTLNETDPDSVLASFHVHCLGALRVTRAVLPFMAHRGKIIFISSRFGSITKVSSGELDNIACSYAYRIAKAAQNMFTQCLSREFRQSGLTVCSIHPGQLKTDSASSDASQTPESAAKALYDMLDHMEHGSFYSLFEGKIPW